MSAPGSPARLTMVAGGGTIEDFNDVAGADTPRWTGSIATYVVERVLSEVSSSGGQDGRLDEVKKTYLVIPSGLPVEVGDTVYYLTAAGATERRVRSIERHGVIGLARLHLWEA